MEEILSKYILHPVLGKLMDNPQEDRFDLDQLLDGLIEAGFRILGSEQKFGLYGWVVAEKPLRVIGDEDC